MTVFKFIIWRGISSNLRMEIYFYGEARVEPYYVFSECLFIRPYTSPNENFEYGYPHDNALPTILSQIKALQAA